MPKWNKFLRRSNPSRQQSQSRIDTVEVLKEYDDPSRHTPNGTSDLIRSYSYDHIDDKIWIKPESPYLSLLSQGGPISDLEYKPSQWQFPKLSVKIVNIDNKTLLLSEAVVRVTSSQINVEPILTVGGSYQGSFYFFNEGWGPVYNPIVSFQLPEIDSKERTLKIETFEISTLISIKNYIPKNLVPKSYPYRWFKPSLIVSGNISYDTATHEKRNIKFQTKAILGEPPTEAGLPPTYSYDLFLEAGRSNYTKYLPISQEIKPGEPDHFLIRVASDKSARFYLTFSFRTTGGKEIPGREVILDLFISRSQSDRI